MISLVKKTLFSILLATLLSGCVTESKISVLQKCSTLGDESIAYARANYIKLFHYFNAEKFTTPYQKVKDYDHITHRNIINTYTMAVRNLKAKDETTKSLLQACIDLASFSKNFVDQNYPRAIALRSESNANPLSDTFFTQVNQIVKFDENIGVFDKGVHSFKYYVSTYQNALKAYRDAYKKELSKD